MAPLLPQHSHPGRHTASQDFFLKERIFVPMSRVFETPEEFLCQLLAHCQALSERYRTVSTLSTLFLEHSAATASPEMTAQFIAYTLTSWNLLCLSENLAQCALRHIARRASHGPPRQKKTAPPSPVTCCVRRLEIWERRCWPPRWYAMCKRLLTALRSSGWWTGGFPHPWSHWSRSSRFCAMTQRKNVSIRTMRTWLADCSRWSGEAPSTGAAGLAHWLPTSVRCLPRLLFPSSPSFSPSPLPAMRSGMTILPRSWKLHSGSSTAPGPTMRAGNVFSTLWASHLLCDLPCFHEKENVYAQHPRSVPLCRR